MKLQFLSKGYGAGLAYQAKRAGVKSLLYLETPCRVGDGLVEKTEEPVQDADAYICDGAGWGKLAEDLRKAGRRVIGGGKWAEVAALKPDYGIRILERGGMEIGEPDQAVTEIVGGWYSGGFEGVRYIGIVRDRLLAGDQGPPVGPVAAELAPIDEHPALEALPADLPYEGPLSVALNGDGLAIGVIPGIQPMVIEAVCEMVRGGFPAVLELEPAGGDVACAMTVSISGWPWALPGLEDVPPIRPDEDQRKHLWPLDVYEEDGAWHWAGTNGVLCAASGRGRPDLGDSGAAFCGHRQAAARCRTTARNLGLTDAQYRMDLGRLPAAPAGASSA